MNQFGLKRLKPLPQKQLSDLATITACVAVNGKGKNPSLYYYTSG